MRVCYSVNFYLLLGSEMGYIDFYFSIRWRSSMVALMALITPLVI